MTDINDEFLDVDFTKDPNYVLGDSSWPQWQTSASIATELFGNSGPSYEEYVGAMTDADIRAEIEKIDAEGGGADQLVTRIFNQGQEGSCVANACSQAVQIVQARQSGKANVIQLSAISLYKRIGRSPGSGAMVSDGLSELTKRGILPLDTPENRAKFGSAVMPATGFYTRFPDNWEATAKLFAGCESYVIRSVEGIFSALCRQHPVVVGREGHSICYVRPMYRNGRRVVKYANSWGNWGDAGYGYDTENQIRKSAGWAFALRTVVRPVLPK